MTKKSELPDPGGPERIRNRLLAWAIVGLNIVIVIVLFGPTLLVSSQVVPDNATRLRLQNDIRGTLLQAAAGIFFLSTAFFTYQQIRLAQRQLDLSREGHATELYFKAIEQLGSDKTEVRVAGIYTLDRMRRQAIGGTREIVPVVTAFIRQHAFLKNRDLLTSTNKWTPPLSSSHPDVQVALNLLSHLRPQPEWHEITDHIAKEMELEFVKYDRLVLQALDLRRADLRNGDFHLCDFQQSLLTNTNLASANLMGTNFSGAKLSSAELSLANLGQCFCLATNFEGARLVYTNLTMAFLSGASLRGADLTDARFSGAYLGSLVLRREWQDSEPDFFDTAQPNTIEYTRRQFTQTVNLLAQHGFFLPEIIAAGPSFGPCDLRQADLRGADLSEAALDDAQLSGARADEKTLWPPGFDPYGAGVLV
jgi:uncharacterized protein YjbI with pentapeptide repeats